MSKPLHGTFKVDCYVAYSVWPLVVYVCLTGGYRKKLQKNTEKRRGTDKKKKCFIMLSESPTLMGTPTH